MTLPILFVFLLVLPSHYEALSVNHHQSWSVQSILRDYLSSSFTPAPPPHTQPAKLARYIVHFSDWASMATISTRKSTLGLPFSNPWSISDGPSLEASSGTPYFYFTDMEMSVHDLHVNNKLSLSMTLAQGDYCKRQALDPQDPPCARVILSGTASRIHNGTEEETFASNAVFSRHPNMRDYPEGHEFYFAKMNVEHICLLAWFGGAKDVSVDDYFNVTLSAL